MARQAPCTVTAVLLLAVQVAGVAGADPGYQVLDREMVEASTGTELSGSAVSFGYDEGALDVPDRAERVRFHVNWTPGGPNPPDLEVTFCEAWCDAKEGGRTLATVEGRGHLSLVFAVPASGNVTWELNSDEPTATNPERVRGTAVYLAPSPDEADPTTDAGMSSANASPIASPGWLAGAGLAVGAGLAAVAVLPRLRRWWPTLVPLFHRSERDELLEHPTRAEIYALVDQTPGIHFSRIADELDIGRANLSQHLEQLEHGDLLVEESVGGYRCYFLPGTVPADLRPCLAMVKADGAREIVDVLGETGETTLSDLADEAGLAVSTVTHHVDRLRTVGAVSTRRERGRRWIGLTDRGHRLAAQMDG